MTDPRKSIARLKAFRSTWNEGDQIDEQSGLTADDLDTVIAAAERAPAITTDPAIDVSPTHDWG